jgi:hypothetical protein
MLREAVAVAAHRALADDDVARYRSGRGVRSMDPVEILAKRH